MAGNLHLRNRLAIKSRLVRRSTHRVEKSRRGEPCDDGQFADAISRVDRAAFTLIELLVVIAIIGVLVALLMPAVQMVREAARRASCANTIRQIGLAGLLYESTRKSLPPPKIGAGDFNTLGSTLVLLLPFVEQGNRFDQYRLNESISAPGNYELTSQPLDIYLCPSMRLNGQPATFGEGSYIISYATKYRPKLNGSTVNGAFDEAPASPGQTYRLGLQAIADGTSNTFFFGEIDNSVRWTGSSANPGAWGHYTWAQGYWFNAQSHVEGKYNQKGPVDEYQYRQYRTFRSDHPGGAHFCMIDGSVRFVGDGVSQSLLEALVTRAGGEVIDPFE